MAHFHPLSLSFFIPLFFAESRLSGWLRVAASGSADCINGGSYKYLQEWPTANMCDNYGWGKQKSWSLTSWHPEAVTDRGPSGSSLWFCFVFFFQCVSTKLFKHNILITVCFCVHVNVYTRASLCGRAGVRVCVHVYVHVRPSPQGHYATAHSLPKCNVTCCWAAWFTEQNRPYTISLFVAHSV